MMWHYGPRGRPAVICASPARRETFRWLILLYCSFGGGVLQTCFLELSPCPLPVVDYPDKNDNVSLLIMKTGCKGWSPLSLPADVQG